MMNRSTQRELIKLLLQFSETLPQIDFGADEQKNMALDILETVAGKCRQDFSKVKADEYTDTMQALSQIIQTTNWHQQGRAENIQCNTLCQDIILQLVENLRHEQEIKKDIVFLPYKASMWDSLESVWKAAYEDKEHCNAYVIPIPYADLNPDRSVAAWHCERDQYPKYVPTLDWREIDLEKWHPDIIFIHNPYDNYNRVTSVESRYYSKNLKQFTDNLVYIPYFVTGGKVISDHFCQTPGVLNADYVICESESIKEVYERNHRVFASVPEGKFLALGSPKYDKVFSSSKEQYPLPENWKKIVGGKKIILYNTSLSAQIQNQEYVISKLTDVLNFFRRRRDFVLWWRPHPLMEATFEAITPDVTEAYREIRDQYCREGWGIYDDTQELNRAILWSNAYYGDESSVLSLYRETCKPFLIQNLDENKNKINFSGIVSAKGKYYIIPNGSSLLCTLNIDTGVIRVEKNLKKVIKECGANDFCSLDGYGNHLIIKPGWGEILVDYNIENEKIEYIKLDMYLSGVLYKFNWSGMYKNKVVLFSWSGTHVVLYDLTTHKLKHLKDVHNALEEAGINQRNNQCMCILNKGFIANHILYIRVDKTRQIVAVDLESEKVSSIFTVGKKELVDICGNEHFIWALAIEEKYLLEYEISTAKITHYDVPQLKDFTRTIWYKIIKCDDNILMFGTLQYKQCVFCIKFDILAHKIEKMIEIQSICEIYDIMFLGNMRLMISGRNRENSIFATIDIKTLKVRVKELKPLEIRAEYMNNIMDVWENGSGQCTPMEMDNLVMLDTFLEYVKAYDYKKVRKRRNSGEIIYQRMSR